MTTGTVSKTTNSPGAPDPTFAQGGYLTLDAEGYAISVIDIGNGNGVCLWKPDKGFGLVCFDSAGNLVIGFGNAGYVFGNFSDDVYHSSSPEEVIIRFDDLIVVFGTVYVSSTRQFFPAAACYDQRGQLFQSFGQGGKTVVWDFHDNNALSNRPQASPASSTEGQILENVIFAFYPFTDGGSYLICLNNVGERQYLFNGNGVLPLMHGQVPLRLTALARQPDGQIVLAAFSEGAPAVIARVKTDGTLDRSFAQNGFHTLNDSSVRLDSLFIRADKTISAVASNPVSENRYMLLLKLDTHGNSEPNFNSGKELRVDVLGLELYPHVLKIDRQGHWCVAGDVFRSAQPNTRCSLLMRFLSSGLADSGFGSGGCVVDDEPGGYQALHLEPDDRFLVGGFTGLFPFFTRIARYLA